MFLTFLLLAFLVLDIRILGVALLLKFEFLDGLVPEVLVSGCADNGCCEY